MIIKRNLIRCLNCNEIIESKYTHDFRSCSCGHVSVDGGLDYLRRGFPSGESTQWYEELSETNPIFERVNHSDKKMMRKRTRLKRLRDYLEEDS